MWLYYYKKVKNATFVPERGLEPYRFCTPFVSYSFYSVRHTQGLQVLVKIIQFVPERGLEPPSLSRRDFESRAYTNSATPAISTSILNKF